MIGVKVVVHAFRPVKQAHYIFITIKFRFGLINAIYVDTALQNVHYFA